MKINGIEIRPGETGKIDVNIAKLPSHSSIDLNITVSRSELPGPSILLSGGLHGDEINGIEIVRRIIEKGYHIPKKGTIICIPIINIFGFINFSRYVPDGKDVNRSFPGSRNGSLASRVAHYLTRDIIPNIDYGIDFHTGGDDRTNYPQIRCLYSDPKNKELADVFKAPFTLNSAFRPKSIRHAAAKKGKNILVYEGGESSRFDEFAIREGLKGTLRVLKHLGMSDAYKSSKEFENKVLMESDWIRAKASGMLQIMIKCGDRVEKGQLLGHITDPFGDFKVPIKCPRDSYVVGLNNNPLLHQGDAIAHLAY